MLLGSFACKRGAYQASRGLIGSGRRAAVLLAFLVLLASGLEPAQTEAERVGLILSKLPPQGSPAYDAIRKLAGKTTGQPLPLTKSEMWSVPKENMDAVKSAASQHGIGVDMLDANWNHVFRRAPADLKLNEQQAAMVKRAYAAQATMGIGIVASAAPAVVEYALTKDATANATGNEAKIILALSERTLLTITRTSVEIRPDMCVWRGAVDGTDAPATILWWPLGKMAGMVQHEGHVFSIRHIGGEIHAIIESSEDRMPPEHAPLPQPRRDPPG